MSAVVLFICLLLCFLTGVTSDFIVIAGMGSPDSDLSEVRTSNGSLFKSSKGVSPPAYKFPEHCRTRGNICQMNVFELGGQRLFVVPSEVALVLCDASRPTCRHLEESTYSDNPFGPSSNQRVPVLPTSIGSTIYLVAVSEERSDRLLIHLGTVTGQTYRSLETIYSENSVDLRLSALNELHVSTLWVSDNGDRAVTVLGSSSLLAFFYLVDSNVTADVMGRLSDTHSERFVPWGQHLFVADAEACGSFSELVPNVANNSVLLVCTGRQKFLPIICSLGVFESCVGGSTLIDASRSIPTPPLHLLFKSTPETTMFFIEQDSLGSIIARHSSSMSNFDNLDRTVLSSAPLKKVSSFYAPKDLPGHSRVVFFTAATADGKYGIFQVDIKSEQPRMKKLTACRTTAACRVISGDEDHLLIGDMLTNSTSVYSVDENRWQSTPFSALSGPILQTVFKSPAVNPITPNGTDGPTESLEGDDNRSIVGTTVGLAIVVAIVAVLGLIIGSAACIITRVNRSKQLIVSPSQCTASTAVSTFSEQSMILVDQLNEPPPDLNRQNSTDSSESGPFSSNSNSVSDSVSDNSLGYPVAEHHGRIFSESTESYQSLPFSQQEQPRADHSVHAGDGPPDPRHADEIVR